MATPEKAARCYELREVWGHGCPNPGCPLLKESAKPVPCIHKISPVIYALEKPLPPDDAPIVSPVGHEEKSPRKGRKQS